MARGGRSLRAHIFTTTVYVKFPTHPTDKTRLKKIFHHGSTLCKLAGVKSSTQTRSEQFFLNEMVADNVPNLDMPLHILGYSIISPSNTPPNNWLVVRNGCYVPESYNICRKKRQLTKLSGRRSPGSFYMRVFSLVQLLIVLPSL